MRTLLITFLFLIVVYPVSMAQTTKTVSPKGVYSEIDIVHQNKMIELLVDTKTKAAAVDTIFNHINQYNPPVLYVFSQALFTDGEWQSGVDWYLFAQLNALYDAHRCSDKTAKQATTILESRFRPTFEDYIKTNKQAYLESVDKVVKLFRKIPQDYDIRWINLHGMDAVTASLGDEKAIEKGLSVPKEVWPDIKEKSIQQFVELNKNSVK